MDKGQDKVIKFYIENSIEIGEFSLEKEVNELLSEFITPYKRSFEAIKIGVILLVNNIEYRNKVTKLYEKIAEILDSTYSSIYRSIRYSLDVAYWQGRLKNKSIGEYKFIEPQTKPTPFEFMNMIREQISTKMNRCFVAKSKALKGGDVIG